MNKKFVIAITITILVFVLGYFIFFFSYCGEGFEYEDGLCVKYDYVYPINDYYCDYGYELSGSQCKKKETWVPTKKYYCEDISSLYGDVDTVSNFTVSYPNLVGSICNVKLSYSAGEYQYCPSGCALYSYTCVCQRETNPLIMGIYPNQYYYCPSGTLFGYKCREYDEFASTTKYYCGSGYYLLGTRCYQDVSYQANFEYECPFGYILNGSICEKETFISAKSRSYCPEGYDEDGLNFCVKRIIENKDF